MTDTRPSPLVSDEDFPVYAHKRWVYRRTSEVPMLECYTDRMAAEIARRLNRDNQVHPETAND